MSRAVCYRCRKAQIMCYCEKLVAFDSQPEFIILVHPKETRKAINTGRMAYLSLSNAHLLEGCNFSNHRQLNERLQDPSRKFFLLFPGAAAEDLNSFRLKITQTESQSWSFIILDATWAMAKKMYSSSANLHALPQIMFQPPSPSGFAIRRQPHAHCYSTIETIHYIIETLGNQPLGEHHQLLKLFDDMVQKQLVFESLSIREKSL